MVVRFLQAFVLVLILAQRLAVPVGGEQLAALVPLVTLFVVVGLGTGVLVVDRRRLALVAVMVATVVGVSLVQIVGGIAPSLLSIALFVVLWAAVITRPRGTVEDGRAVGVFFVRVMCVAAVLSMVQYAVQATGRRWTDLLAQVVPADYVLQQFNSGNPIEYGSTIDRTVAIVFLEPSFLSLFLGLAAVTALRYRLRWPTITLLLLGIVPTVAGNGILILALGVVAFLLVHGRRRLAALIPAAVLAVGVGVLTPLGAIYLTRSTEGGGTNSSTGLRFVQPYVQLIPQPLQQPFTALFGRGAGSARDWITANLREPLLATVFPKTLFEFGVVGIIGVLVPLVIILVRPLGRRPELVGLVFAFLVVNDSLLAGIMVGLVLLILLWLPDLDLVHEPSAAPVPARPAAVPVG